MVAFVNFAVGSKLLLPAARAASSSARAPVCKMGAACEFGPQCGICLGKGTEFSKAVWHVVARIPAGKVWTYGAVAEALGKPSAARAVGRALRSNPHNVDGATPRVPCQRVVAKGGLGGFYGQLDSEAKIKLLRGEGVLLDDNRPNPNKVFFGSVGH